mmetsp:Transcript_3563/g.11077  ORF Transcript_3563/g.11077 Transcript_3563/m.11077 type:complete len:290 (-) Transcript_3563:557-1426(-)
MGREVGSTVAGARVVDRREAGREDVSHAQGVPRVLEAVGGDHVACLHRGVATVDVVGAVDVRTHTVDTKHLLASLQEVRQLYQTRHHIVLLGGNFKVAKLSALLPEPLAIVDTVRGVEKAIGTVEHIELETSRAATHRGIEVGVGQSLRRTHGLVGEDLTEAVARIVGALVVLRRVGDRVVDLVHKVGDVLDRRAGVEELLYVGHLRRILCHGLHLGGAFLGAAEALGTGDVQRVGNRLVVLVVLEVGQQWRGSTHSCREQLRVLFLQPRASGTGIRTAPHDPVRIRGV